MSARVNQYTVIDRRITHEGAPAKRITPEQELRRSVLACLLWEDTFYESGEDIAARIARLAHVVPLPAVAALAVEARTRFNLRHAPLWLTAALTDHPQKATAPGLVGDTIAQVIQRADELAEFAAMLLKRGRKALATCRQVKRGLAKAFGRFDAYALAKYDRSGPVRLRDVLFLSHAKPRDEAQAALWKALVDGTLPAPDTWEVALSGGADKRATFERLIAEGKLGALALLRNLRGMTEAGVPADVVRGALAAAKVDRVLPYRFIAAAKYGQQFEPELEAAMFRAAAGQPKLAGQTMLLVDVSGSMDTALSDKSEMTRLDAACALAMLAREQCEHVRVATFSAGFVEVPPRRGFALRDVVRASQPHASTYLGSAVQRVHQTVPHDRLIVITDEQSHDRVPDPLAKGRAYMINVAAYQNGVGYGPWAHIDGWSQAVLTFLAESEAAPQ